MPQSIVVKAKTTEEAISQALNSLQVDRSEVTITILREPSRYALGLLAVSAEVQVTVNSVASENTASLPPSGCVWVEEGELQYLPPKEGDSAPTLLFSDPIRVKYKGEEGTQRVVLDEGTDQLEILLPENQEPYKHIDVEISSDSLSASVKVYHEEGIHYSLCDSPSTKIMQLRLESMRIDAPRVTESDIQHKLDVSGIKYGLDTSVITEELLKERSFDVVVAKALPPTPPQDSWIEYHFEEKQETIRNDEERIDHYETQALVTVDNGELLATKHLGILGQDGVDVFGRVIPALKGKEVEILAGEGVRLSSDNLQAFANRSGMPLLQKEVLRVMSIYELKKNADLSTGNIRFKGEVIIRGDVCDQIQIEAITGGIKVFGMVSYARIKADRDIDLLKSVISSQISAGGITVAYLKILSYLSNLNHQITQLLHGFSIVYDQHATSHGKLIKSLLELKFHNIPRQVAELAQYFESVAELVDNEFDIVIQELQSCFIGRGPLEIDDIKVLEELSVEMKVWEEILKNEISQPANISVNILQNSKLEASGVVVIKGKESYYSKIIAGKGLRQNRGVFRGGEIIVDEGDIVIREIGGPTGISTSASINNDGTMKLGIVHPNVTVAIGNQKFIFDKPVNNVKVYFKTGLRVFSGSSELHK